MYPDFLLFTFEKAGSSYSPRISLLLCVEPLKTESLSLLCVEQFLRISYTRLLLPDPVRAAPLGQFRFEKGFRIFKPSSHEVDGMFHVVSYKQTCNRSSKNRLFLFVICIFKIFFSCLFTGFHHVCNENRPTKSI